MSDNIAFLANVKREFYPPGAHHEAPADALTNSCSIASRLFAHSFESPSSTAPFTIIIGDHYIFQVHIEVYYNIFQVLKVLNQYTFQVLKAQ